MIHFSDDLQITAYQNMDEFTLTEVIKACELKWRYRKVDEGRFMQIFGK